MADTEVVRIINIKTNQAINSVKELKQYISELTDDLVKVDKGSKQYEETLEEIGKANKILIDVQRDSKNSLDAQVGSYRALNKELVALRNEYKSYTEEERNNAEVGGKTLARIQELDKELKDIDATMGNHQRSVGHYQLALEALNADYATQRQELRALKGALDNLEPGTKEYEEAFNRMATITHNLSEQQEMLRYSSADLGSQINNIRGIASNMVAGFSAVNAAMGLFGQKNEDVAKAMLKVQQCMAIVQGLQGMDGLLKRTKGLSNAMKVWFKSTKDVTSATNAQTVAQKGLNAAMKANPIGIILTAVMTLAVVIKPLISLIEKLTGKFNEMNNSASASTAAMKELDETIENMDRNNKLETMLMQASGLSEISIIEKKIKNETEKLEKTTEAYNRQLGYVVDNIKQYGKNGGITTGTLKELGYEQDQINDLMKTGEINIKESDKALKNFTKNEGFKTMLDNVLQLNTNIKDIKKNINSLNDDAKVANVKSAVDAAKEATKKREQIEQDYINNIQKKYGSSVAETIEDYKKEIKTLQDYVNGLNFKDLDIIGEVALKSLKATISEAASYVNTLGKEINNPKQILGELSKNLEGIKKAFNSRLNDAIEDNGKEAAKKVNDEIVKLFEKTIQPDLNTELAKIQNQLDKTDLKLNFELETGYNYNTWVGSGLFEKIDGFNKKQAELAKVSEDSKLTLRQLNVELDHYQQIVDFVNENDLVPSDEYDKAIQKIEEINQKIQQENIRRWESEMAINKKYFQLEIQQAESETQKMLDAIDEEFTFNAKSRYNKSGLSGFLEALGFNDSFAIEQEKRKVEEIFQAEKDGLERLKDLWKQRSTEEGLSLEEREEAQKNYVETIRQLNLLEVEYDKQKYEEKKQLIQSWVSVTQTAISTIGELFSTLADYYKDDIDAQKDKNKITNDEAKKQYEQKVQPLMIAQATISMLQGMVTAFASAMQLGPIAGPIVGSALAAMVGAMGALNIAKIKNTNPYDKGGSASSAAASVPTQDYDFSPTYVQNTTSESDIDNLRNALTEQPLRAYVVESDITNSQNLAAKRNQESSF